MHVNSQSLDNMVPAKIANECLTMYMVLCVYICVYMFMDIYMFKCMFLHVLMHVLYTSMDELIRGAMYF